VATRPSPDESDGSDSLRAEHKALKQQMAALRREHNRLHAEGGTREEHRQHIEHLRAKIKELEAHGTKLKNRKENLR
jgi:prefoldin subunit 5